MVMVKDDSGKQALQQIYKDVVNTIEGSKSQIFSIYEKTCWEIEQSKKDLDAIIARVGEMIADVDRLRIVAQQKKQELARVSQKFSTFSEEDIKKCYAETEKAQIELAIAIEKEKQLRQQRDRLQIRLHGMQDTVNTAKNLAVQIGVVMGYLGTQLGDMVEQFDSASKGKLLAIQVITAQENERLRMSREIHDGPAQTMANLIYQSMICERMLDVDPGAVRLDLQDLRCQARGCLSELRQIIFDLRPMALEDLDLSAAVQQFIVKFKERSSLEVDFIIEGTPVPLNKFVEVSLFRIIQEALNNIQQHADAEHVILKLSYNRTNVSLSVEDDGVGFDTENGDTQLDENGVPEHFGITGMRERANIIKAQFLLSTAAGKGTKVRVYLPLEDI